MSKSDCLRCPACGSSELDRIDERIRGYKFLQERLCRRCKHIVAFIFKIIEIKIKNAKITDDRYVFVTD
ncbi:MAG TPA: hypothetical protein PKW98_05790 [Candidatus Wallbacteria bacterium]|nr:MAG: hypothetical protein BWY32_01871 [bacterium ADurb.Bin243]HPG57308.1 hypothetical protein [Candidatus Wallbacteria bacterium]